MTSYYSPFFPLSLKVSIKPAARRPPGKIEGNGGKAATSCLTLGYGIWGKRTSWFPRPTFHRDLASSAARSRSTSSHPPTHPPNFSLLSIDSQLVSFLNSSSFLRGYDRIDRIDRIEQERDLGSPRGARRELNFIRTWVIDFSSEGRGRSFIHSI